MAALGEGLPNPYLILGHGIEDVSDASRKPLPPGVTLVTLTMCGNSTYMKHVCPFIKMFQDPANEAILRDPARFKKAIEAKAGFPIRVTRPGQKYPFYVVNYLAKFGSPPETVSIVKSGIYPFPITPEMDVAPKWKKDPVGGKEEHHCDTFFLEGDGPKNPTSEILEEVYRGSIYPPLPAGDLTQKTYSHIGKLLTEPFDEAIASLPTPAVYYYVICRAPFQQSETNVYKQIPHPYSGKRIPGSENLDKLAKVLGLKHTPENIASDEDYFPGVAKLIEFTKNNAKKATEPKVVAFLESIKPRNTKNSVEEYEDLLAKVELVKRFNTTEGITDPKLKEVVEEFKNSFVHPTWVTPIFKPNVKNMIVRRRAESNVQQANLEAALDLVPASASAEAEAEAEPEAEAEAEAKAKAVAKAETEGGGKRKQRRRTKKGKKSRRKHRKTRKY